MWLAVSDSYMGDVAHEGNKNETKEGEEVDLFEAILVYKEVKGVARGREKEEEEGLPL